jgi:ribonucleoside-diphosphate reductase alpha chain
MKLKKLLNYAEPLSAFHAATPATGRMERYPSVVAYLARLIIHRYAMLGLLSQEGHPVQSMGVMVAVA